ncbi:hypothetical protein V1511DRAFT_490528 [Dipodascopsis uninucleata]
MSNKYKFIDYGQVVKGDRYNRKGKLSCESCRSRKIKCDESRPICSGCSSRKLACVYRTHASPESPTDRGSLSPDTGSQIMSDTAASPTTALKYNSYRNSYLQYMASFQNYSTNDRNISALPAQHTLRPMNLIQWPRLAEMLPEGSDIQSQLRLFEEKQNAPSRAIRLSEVGNKETKNDAVEKVLNSHRRELYFDTFMKYTFIWYPIIDPVLFKRTLEDSLSEGDYTVANGVLMASVFALGAEAVAATHEDYEEVSYSNSIRNRLREFCDKHMSFVMNSTTIADLQALFLLGVYSVVSCKVLEAHRYLALTWTGLQYLLNLGPQQWSNAEYDILTRIYWCLFILDSELRAEFDLMPIGIEALESTVGMPKGYLIESKSIESYGGITIWYYLCANIASRRLLNRVHSTMYDHDPENALQKPGILFATTQELLYQLEMWRQSLPASLYFDESAPFSDFDILDPAPVDNYRLVLRIKYGSTFIVVNRFYMYSIVHSARIPSLADNFVSSQVREKAIACIKEEIGLSTPSFSPSRKYLRHYISTVFVIASLWSHSIALILSSFCQNDLPIPLDALRKSLYTALQSFVAYIPKVPIAGKLYSVILDILRKLNIVDLSGIDFRQFGI